LSLARFRSRRVQSYCIKSVT